MDPREELQALRRLKELEDRAAAAEPRKASVIDAPNAVATGFNRGLLNLAGLPVDTVANVIDLGKAALGTAYSATTGKPVPDALTLTDRAKVVGSGANLIERSRATAPGKVLLDPQNPSYEGGYLQAAGGGLTAIANPSTRGQAINQAVLGVTGALAGKATMDATGNEALAVTASMLPLGVQRAVTEGSKRLVRGDEAGRRQMEQRIQDLRNAGVDNPTLGLASGNQAIGGAENLLQNAPGAVKIMRNAREGAVNALAQQSSDAAALASPDRGSLAAGRGIQSGLNNSFKDAFKSRQNELYNALADSVGGQTPTNIDRTRATLAMLNEDIQGAPEVSKFFKNGKIQALERAVNADVNAERAYSPSQLRAAAAQATNVDELNGALANRALPFEAVKKTRTLVGNELADHSLLSDVPKSKWNPLYGALTEDMKAAAAKAGPDATRAFNRATDYTRAGLNRMERVATFADRPAPEQSFGALERTLGENVSTFQAVKKSLPEGVRGQVAGTVIEELGKARAGVQNETGSVWSPETFLTNWNRMTPQARNELLSGFPNAPQVKADIEAVAKATSMMRDNSKLWANPSGSGANVAARATLGGVGVGGAAAALGLVNPAVPMVAAGGILSSNLLARALTNKGVVQSFARPDTNNPQLTQAQINTLVGAGLLDQRYYRESEADRK